VCEPISVTKRVLLLCSYTGKSRRVHQKANFLLYGGVRSRMGAMYDEKPLFPCLAGLLVAALAPYAPITSRTGPLRWPLNVWCESSRIAVGEGCSMIIFAMSILFDLTLLPLTLFFFLLPKRIESSFFFLRGDNLTFFGAHGPSELSTTALPTWERIHDPHLEPTTILLECRYPKDVHLSDDGFYLLSTCGGT
jgi:hypothetical protein